jgi:hypothetical protein
MPIILASWEVEIGGLKLEASLGKNVSEPYFKKQAGHGKSHL